MSDKPRLPFALLDGALSGVQSAVRTVTGLAKAPFASADQSAEARTEAQEPVGSEQDASVPAPLADTVASPAALATAALDEKAARDLGTRAEPSGGSVIDRIPRADASHSGHEQPAPDEELGPEPFTPQVGP